MSHTDPAEPGSTLPPTTRLGPDRPATDPAPTGPVGPSGYAGTTADFPAGPPPARPPVEPPTDRPSETRRRFGRYEVTGELGRGGFGTVYRAWDPVLRREVAVKVARRVRSRAQVDEMMHEARRLAQVSHPGIVAVFDVGEQDGGWYIVTDLLPGRSLAARGADRPGWEEAVRLAAAVADALAHAHARGLVHRDVKPGNIFVTADGRPVLLDFGLALGELDPAETPGLVAGTPAYMAPEQAAGRGHRIDGRTDLYALGVVLYELVCGRLPFRSPDREELLRQIAEDDPQPPRQLAPHLPAALEKIILRALAKKPGDRFTTAGDFASALRSLAVDTPAPATTPGPAAAAETDAPGSSSVRRRREAERRQVTVAVFAVDAPDGDPEHQLELARAVGGLLDEAAVAFGGTLLPGAAQEPAACFGFPVAHEDAAARAVRAALAVLAKADDPTRVAAVVHSGEAVAEEAAGGVTLAGDVVPAASRVAGQVDPGAVLVTHAARRLVGGEFETAPAGAVKLRGSAGPVEVWRVVRDLGRPNRVELTDPGNLSPLVGRDTEVGVLRDRWERAADGAGQVVLLVGDPGLGKSRLIRELREHVAGGHESGFAGVVEWRCSAYHQNTGFYPAVEFLERLLRFGRSEGLTDRPGRLAEHLAGLGLDAPEHVALLAALLGLPPDPRYPLPPLTPQRQRERTVDLLLGWLAAYAGGRPLLFVAEDLHWADPSTVDLLSRFVGESGGQAVLAVLTTRPEFRPPWPDPAHQTRIGLSKLTRRQLGELIARRVGRADVPAGIVEQVAARTDGVPLFVEEFATLVQEAGLLDRPADGESVELRVVPATLQDLLLARLDRLGSDPAVVQLAAAVGREFDHELIAAASDLPAAALAAELDKLVGAEVLFRKGRLPRCGYIFKHALIQDAAYGAILRGRRQQYHRRIGEVFERDFPGTAETKPELLAHHWTAAGDTAKAMHYWRAAGTQAQERSAHVEAVRHLSRGQELVAGLPAGPDRDGAELGFRVPLATSYLALRGYASPEVEEQTVKARELCERLGPDAPLFPVMMTLWALRFIQGQNRLAADLSREVVALAAGRDDGHKAEAEWSACCTAWWAGRFADALAHGDRAIGLWQPEAGAAHARVTGQHSGPLATAYTGLALWCLGRGREARDRWAAGTALAERVKHPFTLAATIWQTGFGYALAGDAAGAAAVAERVMAVSEENGFAFWVGLGRSLKGAALVLAGRPAEAVPLLEDGIARVEATGCQMVHQNNLGWLADALWQTGRRAEAWAALDRALAVTGRDAERYVESELLRRKAQFLADEGDAAEAERLLTEAKAVAAGQGARYFELRAAVALGRLWAVAGRAADARSLVAPLVAGFPDDKESADLIEARTFLVTLGG